MKPRSPWIQRVLLGALMGTALSLAVVGVILATSGVFDRRPGAWTVPVRPLPGITVEANVAGLVRLATSPIGLRLLDGHTRTTRIGRLRFSRERDTLVMRCAPCRIDAPRLADRTVALPPIELRATQRAGIESNRLVDLRASTHDLGVDAVAQLSPAGIDLAWSLPATAIAGIYRVFADAVPEARIARIDGHVQASGTLALPSLRAASEARLDGFEVGGLATERLQSGWFTFRCRAGDGTTRTLAGGDGERGWLDAPALGTLLSAAVLAAEDQRFAQHAGFDPVEIAQALAAFDLDGGDAPALRSAALHADDPVDRASPQAATGSQPPQYASTPARPLRGASTITQQLARTLFTGGERTAARKLRELLYAAEIERTLGKERILLLYLNTVDWGPGLCGARAAARTYFNKRPSQLTPLEAAWLAGILRAPHLAHAQQFSAQRAQTERARWVLMQMRDLPRRERVRWARAPLVFAPPKAAPAPTARRIARGKERPASS